MEPPESSLPPDDDPPSSPGVSDEGLRWLFEAVFNRYGLDFRRYAASYLRRRVLVSMGESRAADLKEFHALVLEDPAAMASLRRNLTIHTTTMFRDPDFHIALRASIVPVLRTYPFVRVWVAGCSTGEEAYSLAILLHEEGLYPRCRIYATDANETLLARASERIFPLPAIREYAENYRLAGGRRAFSEYYSEDGRAAILRSFLAERIVFSQHNLVSDGSFNQFHLVLCRNVLIYFDQELQARVHELIRGSLVRLGFLGLGKGESLSPFEGRKHYQALDSGERIYRRIN